MLHRRPNLSLAARLLSAAAGAALLAGASQDPAPVSAPEPAARAETYLGFPARGHAVRVELVDGEASVSLDGAELPAERLRQQPDRLEILADDGETVLAAVHLARGRGGFQVSERSPRVRLGMQVGVTHEGDGAPHAGEGYAIVVTGVEPGLPADLAGVRVHDMLRSIDDREELAVEDVREILAGKAPGEEVDVRVDREGRQVDLVVRLEGDVHATGDGHFALPFARPAFGIGKQGRVMFWSSKHFSREEFDPEELAQDVEILARLDETFEVQTVEGADGATEDVERQALKLTMRDIQGGAFPFRCSLQVGELEERLDRIEAQLAELLARSASADSESQGGEVLDAR